MTVALVHFNHSSDGNLTTWPDMRTSQWKPNYGDMLVCASILRELEMPETIRVGFGGELSKPVDRALIRGSTYLHNRMDFEAVNKTLDSIDAPLAIVGLGAQNPNNDLTFLDENHGAREFVARLNDKSQSISVRGEFTADVVRRLGGKNVRITGCPSVFYSGRPPEITVPARLGTENRKIGISLHSGLRGDIFCASPSETRAYHANVIRHSLDTAEKTVLFEQGVLKEFQVADTTLPYSERLAAAQHVIASIGAQEKLTPDELISSMASVKSIEEWLEAVADLDAVIGFRFHGNMVALLQGKPCYYYVYDSRIQEFCELYGLPYQNVTDPWRDPYSAIQNHDWESANKKIESCFAELSSFYLENGFDATFNPHH